jgi:mannose-6-phosphate isomerase-like protein (cupin superfamily)
MQTEISGINLKEKLEKINDYWHPHILAELNGQQVKLAKIKGEFVWHKHDNEDELFMVISGQLKMELRDKTITLNPNEIIVIPRGVEHRPVALEETTILLFEPDTTLNTGNIVNDLTRHNLDKI